MTFIHHKYPGGNFPRVFLKSLLFIYFLAIGFSHVIAQPNKVNQSIGFSASALFDNQYIRVGKSFDLFYERRIYNKFYVKAGVNFSSTQRLLGNEAPKYQLYIPFNTDEYGAYFRGRPIEENFSFLDNKSFIKNTYLVGIGLSYRFGKRNQFIPELGFSLGSAYEASIALKGVSWINDTIVNASSEARFSRNYVSGAHMGFSYAIRLRNNFYLQPAFRLFLLQPPRKIETHATWFDGTTLGITIRKDLIKKKEN